MASIPSSFKPIDPAPLVVSPSASPASDAGEETTHPSTEEGFVEKIDGIIKSITELVGIPPGLGCNLIMAAAGTMLINQCDRTFTKELMKGATQGTLRVTGIPVDPWGVIERLGKPAHSSQDSTVVFKCGRISYLAFMPDDIAGSSREVQADWVRAFYAQMYWVLLGHFMPSGDMPNHFNIETTEQAVQLIRIMVSFMSQCMHVIQDIEEGIEWQSPNKNERRAFGFPPPIAEKERYFNKSSTHYNVPNTTYQRKSMQFGHVDREQVCGGAIFASLTRSPDGLGLASSSRGNYCIASCIDFCTDAVAS